MKKTELFSLIKSLTKSEKRYFKVFCNQIAGSNNYLRLFDAMEQQITFDEQLIREQFAGETFVKQLHVTKNYLRQLVLKALRNYHSKISKDAELKSILLNIEILFNKELFDACLTELKKGEKLASAYELKTGLIEIINWKRKIEQAIRPQNYPAFQQILAQQDVAIQQLHNTHAYWRLAVNQSQGMFANSTSKMDTSLLEEDEKATSLEAKVLLYNTLYIRELQQGNDHKAVDALERLIAYLETLPIRLKEDPALYVSTVNNLLGYFVIKKTFDKALNLLNRSKGFYADVQFSRARKSLLKQIFRTYNMELEIYRVSDLLDNRERFIQEMEQTVMNNQGKIPQNYLISFWFQFAHIHFMDQEYDQALKWINLIMNNQWKSARMDIQVQVRMLNLMTHLEKRNFFVMRYFVDGTKRFLRKQNWTGPYESLLLSFFSKMGRLPELEWAQAFQQLKKDWTKIQAVGKEPKDYSNYTRWIEGNLRG